MTKTDQTLCSRLIEAENIYRKLNQFPHWIQKLINPSGFNKNAEILNNHIDYIHDMIPFASSEGKRKAFKKRLKNIDYIS